jgi:hypothetical protein
MYVFENCTAFRRTMPLLQYDEHSPEDLDTTGEDHIADETRYFLMSRPVKPHAIPGPEDKDQQLQLLLDVKPEDVRITPRPRMEIRQ